MDKETLDKQEVKKFQKGFLLFFIGHIFLTIGAFYIGVQFKVIPSWVGLFVIFFSIAYILMGIGIFYIYRFNKNLTLAFITIGIQLVIGLLANVASTSMDDSYLFWSKGLEWSSQILLCIFYVYFFLGCHDYFASLGIERAKKHSRTGFIVFPILYTIQLALTLGKDFKVVKYNLIANRMFLYGSWLFNFVIYFFVLSLLILIVVYMHKLRKEDINNESKAS